MSNGNGHTMAEKILKVLSDGKRHPVEELEALAPFSTRQLVHQSIYGLRRKLSQRGEDIVCVRRGYKSYYQHVRLLHSPYDGVH